MPDFLNVNEVLHNLDLKDSMLAAEFGCGSADFSMALARKLKKGRVYALDIQEEKLSALQSKMNLEKLTNVSMVLSDLEELGGSTLHENYLDVVLIPNVLFQAENKHVMIEEAKRILKNGGQLLIVDWLKGAPFGPREDLITPEEMKKMTTDLGFTLKKEFAAGDYHYALLFTK